MAVFIDYAEEICKQYGFIRRARGYHLYTSKGTRLLDMYQEGGRAILGWRGGHSQKTLKNLIDCGICGTFPSSADYTLTKAIQNLVPQYSVIRWYSTESRARYACARYFDLWMDLPLVESVVIRNSLFLLDNDAVLKGNGITIWRPWLDDAWYSIEEKLSADGIGVNWGTSDVIAIPLPFPLAGQYYAVAFAYDNKDKILASDPLPAAFTGAIARACNDLYAEMPKRCESNWNCYDDFILPYWERRGPYLIPHISEEQYKDFFLYCLKNGILISPIFSTPSIIPFGVDKGEFKALVQNPFPVN